MDCATKRNHWCRSKLGSSGFYSDSDKNDLFNPYMPAHSFQYRDLPFKITIANQQQKGLLQTAWDFRRINLYNVVDHSHSVSMQYNLPKCDYYYITLTGFLVQSSRIKNYPLVGLSGSRPPFSCISYNRHRKTIPASTSNNRTLPHSLPGQWPPRQHHNARIMRPGPR